MLVFNSTSLWSMVRWRYRYPSRPPKCLVKSYSSWKVLYLESCPKNRPETAREASASDELLWRGQVAAVYGGGQVAGLKTIGAVNMFVENSAAVDKWFWPGMRK